MDKAATVEELKSQVQKFCEEREWDQYHAAKDLAIGLITESSELLEHFRFQSEKDVAALMKDPAAREEIGHELADSLFFILRFAQMYDFDLSDTLKDKLAHSAKKYPVDKFKGSNRKYDSSK